LRDPKRGLRDGEQTKLKYFSINVLVVQIIKRSFLKTIISLMS